MSMKKRKLAWLLAASMTLTSFSGAGLTGYAEEESLILDEVEEEGTEAVDVSEGVVLETAESEAELADAEEADPDVFIESVEEVDGIATQSAEVADDGFVIEQHWKRQMVLAGESILLQTNVKKNKGVELLYQWYIEDEYDEWKQISGVSGENYLLENFPDYVNLKCVVTNVANLKTDTVWFSVEKYEKSTDSITIEDYTEIIYVYPDESPQLWVKASSNKGTLQYKWYEEVQDVDEEYWPVVATTASFSPEMKGAYYKCEISDGYSKKYVYCIVDVYFGFIINDEKETIDAKSGERVRLSVDVETGGFSELKYQWYKCREGEDDEEIAGATSAQYTTEPLGTDSSYHYTCVVSDGHWECYAYRTIKTDYNIIVDKESDDIYAEPNQTVTLSVKASTGKGKLTYRWVKREWNEDEYVEETVGASPDLIISNPQPGETIYTCCITNGYTEIEVYRTVICSNPDFAVEGGCTKYIRPGESTELKVIAFSENATLSYDWYCIKNKYNEDNDDYEYYKVSLGTGKSIRVNEAGEYYCEVSNGELRKTVYYSVRIEDGFQLLNTREDIKVPYGKCAELKVEASVTYGALKYRWYKNDEQLKGQTKATLKTDPIVRKGQYDEYVCEICDDDWEEKGEVIFRVGMENGDGSAEKTVWLSVEAPKRVSVAYGGSATLSVNAKSEDVDNLTYKWYRIDDEMLEEDIDSATFLSRRKTLTIYNVREVRRYVCTVSDGVTEQKVKILVGPQEKMDLYAEDEEHAKLVPINGSSRAISGFWRGYVYFKFIPDQTGPWTFSFERDWWIKAVMYDESGKIVANLWDDMSDWNRELSPWTPELQAGKTYFIMCKGLEFDSAVAEKLDITVHNKYIGEVHEHTWNSGTITKQPTCVTQGVKTYTCSGCQKTRTEEIPATGAHTMVTITDRAATCGTAGSQHRECTVCHLKEAGTSIPATGVHTMVTVTDRAATCGTEGSQHRECTVCHLKEAGTGIPATGAHRYGAYTVTQQPTVLAAGIQVRACGVCGRTESASIPKLTGTMTLKAGTLPLQLKKTVELKTIVIGLMAGDSIASCSSNNTKVATVSPTGKVTAKKAGKATITITLASGVSQSVTVKVQKGAVKTSKISGVASKVTLEAGKSLALSPVITPVTTKDKLSYSSSNKKVATVSKSGVITAKASGKAKITIKSGSKKFVVTVTVPKKAPTGMQGIPATKSLKKGKSFAIKAKLLPAGAEAKITYKSSNKKVATVNAKGKVTAKKAGTAVITVSAGGIKQTCTVTVK